MGFSSSTWYPSLAKAHAGALWSLSCVHTMTRSANLGKAAASRQSEKVRVAAIWYVLTNLSRRAARGSEKWGKNETRHELEKKTIENEEEKEEEEGK